LDQKDLQLKRRGQPFPTVVDPSDPNELALNPKVSYCVVIYSKHSRKNIILDPFHTVVDPSDPNELALNPKVSYCVVIYIKHSRKNIILKGSSIMFFLQCLLYITTQ
jgi:IMP cyclohydrolase